MPKLPRRHFFPGSHGFDKLLFMCDRVLLNGRCNPLQFKLPIRHVSDTFFKLLRLLHRDLPTKYRGFFLLLLCPRAIFVRTRLGFMHKLPSWDSGG